MSLESSPMRRLAVAAFALAVTGTLLRSQLSAALTVRGDDLLYQSDQGRALQFYRRALFFDPGNATAVDRYVFVSMMAHRPTLLARAILVGSAYLAKHANDLTILMDRALCEDLLLRYRSAESDFARVGLASRDPRALVFAGYAALREGRRARAHRWWRAALAVSSGYPPALRALRFR